MFIAVFTAATHPASTFFSLSAAHCQRHLHTGGLSVFCCHSHFRDTQSYVLFETELSRTHKTLSAIMPAPVVTEFYNIWWMRNYQKHVCPITSRLFQGTAFDWLALPLLWQLYKDSPLLCVPQYCVSISGFHQFQILANKSKSPLWQAGAEIPNLPVPLTLKNERKDKKGKKKKEQRTVHQNSFTDKYFMLDAGNQF